MCHGSDSRPIANLLFPDDGSVWVLAAGATNTNGKGKSIQFSSGTVPADSMNTYAIGAEIANNGVGEAFPQRQIDAVFKANNACAKAYGFDPGDLSTHQFYAQDRKIDPATNAAVQGPWSPRSATSSGTWNRDDVVAEAKRRAGSAPTPGPKPPTPPIPGDEDDMPAYAIQAGTGSDVQKAAIFWWDGKQIGHIPNPTARDVGYFVGMYAMNGDTGKPLDNFSSGDIQGLINVGWAGGPLPPGYTAPKAVDSGTS